MPQDASNRIAEEELLELIGELLNGTATAAQHERLSALLAAGPEARRTYRRYVNLHVALHCYCGTPAHAPDAGDTAPEGEPPEAAATRGSLPREPIRRARNRRAALLVLAASAAALLAAAVLRFGPYEIGRPRAQSVAETCVAVVSKVAKARWESDVEPPHVGSGLPSGVLRLAEGYAELTFQSGARLVLDAPVTIHLVDAATARLQLGRVVALVPPQARGFAIETPRARVIDQGTEFGVGVRSDGDTEVQVFQGVVVTEWTGPEGDLVNHRLEAGQAVRIDRQTGATPQGIPYYPEGFVRTFPTDREPDEPGGPLYNRSRFDTVHVVPAPEDVVVNGDLSDWDRSGAFYSACLPPFHENYYLEGMMMYDESRLYLGAHVGDPAPMRSVMDPAGNPQQFAWRGGSVIVRMAVSPELGWPLRARGPAEGDRTGDPQIGRRPEDVSDKIVHLVMWYHRPAGKPRLLLSFGMDFHGERVDPGDWQGAFRADPNGRGYTLEYAVPWSLLNAPDRRSRAGDVLAANWTVHWSDQEGTLSRGNLIEITNLEEQPFRFLRGSAWGKAIFHARGNLAPGTVTPKGEGHR